MVSSAAVAALAQIARFRRIPLGQVIWSDHQELTCFAVVVSGVIKLVKTHRDGRQQIVGLLFPADFVGRPYSERYSPIAQATTNLELCCFSKRAFEAVMVEHPSLQNVLLRRALDALDASREWMFLLGRKTAREKVASLLATVAVRFAQANGDDKPAPLTFNLPLSRNEIADTLGLRLETVSREIRYLNLRGVIATSGRRKIAVPDLRALTAIAEGELE